jgi:hypothetical protein
MGEQIRERRAVDTSALGMGRISFRLSKEGTNGSIIFVYRKIKRAKVALKCRCGK